METIAVFMSYARILRVPSSPTNTIAGVLLSRTRDRRAALLEEEVLHHFELMSSRLTGYASSFDLSRQDAEDVVQDVFLALFRHLQQDRPRDNLRAWLYQVTHNLALKRRLRNVAEPVVTVADFERIDTSQNPEEALLLHERHAQLQASVKALPLIDQQCLRLRAEGLRYREIGKILGISLGSVSASLARSLARLQRAERR